MQVVREGTQHMMGQSPREVIESLEHAEKSLIIGEGQPAPERKSNGKLKNVCPECDGPTIRDHARGEELCNDCGLVVNDNIIDTGPEWTRDLSGKRDSDPSRVGMPATALMHDRGLSTEISKENRDSNGRPISPRVRETMYHLRRWNKKVRVGNSHDRNLTTALNEIIRLSSALNLRRDISETAAELYRKAMHKGLSRGRSIETLVAAVVYAGCRIYGVPRTLDEIAAVARAGKKYIGRTHRFVSSELAPEIEAMTQNLGHSYVPLPDLQAMSYIDRFCAELRLGHDAKSKAKELIGRAKELKLTTGRGPQGLAAATIFIAAYLTGDQRAQREIADVSGVSEVTIRNRYKELANELDIEIVL